MRRETMDHETAAPAQGDVATDASSETAQDPALTHLPAQNRYVYRADGKDVGLTDYELHGSAIHLTHTEIDPEERGSGLGDDMVQAVLDTIRLDSDHTVVALCPFVVDFIERHPEYEELLER